MGINEWLWFLYPRDDGVELFDTFGQNNAMLVGVGLSLWAQQLWSMCFLPSADLKGSPGYSWGRAVREVWRGKGREIRTITRKGIWLSGRRGKGSEAELGIQEPHHPKLITHWQYLGVIPSTWWTGGKKNIFQFKWKQNQKSPQSCKKQGETLPWCWFQTQ